MTNGHHHTKPDGSRQQTHHARPMDTTPQQQRQPNNTLWRPSSNTQRRQDPPISQTRRRPVENVVGMDTGLEGVETNGCYSAGYAARWVSGASIAANVREIASDLSRRWASEDRTMLPLPTNGQANRGGAAVVRSCDDWWEQLQSHNRHRSNDKHR